MQEISSRKNNVPRAKWELMVVRLCNEFRMSRAETYADLPENIKALFLHFPYNQIIRPLVLADRKRGMSIEGLAIKYAVHRRSIQHYINNPHILCVDNDLQGLM